MKWYELTAVLCSNQIPLYLKWKGYQSVARPVTLNEVEYWTMTKKYVQSLDPLEMRILEQSVGWTRLDEDVWKTLGVANDPKKMWKSCLW